MRTKLAKDLGLEFPIFAFSHCRDVVAAVSRAGGMGGYPIRVFSSGSTVLKPNPSIMLDAPETSAK